MVINQNVKDFSQKNSLEAVKQTESSKSNQKNPGTDGLPAGFSKVFLERHLSLPPMLSKQKLSNRLGKTGNISLIPKKEKAIDELKN